MTASRDDAYAPKKLRSEDLRAPLTANLRRLPPAVRDELHAARVRLVDRLHPWGTTRREARKRSVLAGALGIPVVCLFLTPLPGAGILLMGGLGALYGLAVSELHPLPTVSGFLMVGLVALAHAVTGTPLLLPAGVGGIGAGFYFLVAICRLLVLFCLGMMLMFGRDHVGD